MNDLWGPIHKRVVSEDQMKAFLYAYQWHYQTFAIDSSGDIWRFYFEVDGTPYIMRLIGNESEYAGPIAVLKSMMRGDR